MHHNTDGPAALSTYFYYVLEATPRTIYNKISTYKAD